MEVPSITMGALLTQHGVPHYLKIDIEGMDRECLRSIDPSNNRSTSLWNYRTVRILSADCRRLGIAGSSISEPSPPRCQFFLMNWSLAVSEKDASRLSRARWRQAGFDAFPSRFGWHFPGGALGRSAEETFGPWLTADRGKRLYERIQRAFVRGDWPLSPLPQFATFMRLHSCRD